MSHPIRKRLPHAIPDWVRSDSYYFITINCDPRNQNHLCRAGIGDALLNSAAHYNKNQTWICRILLLMPDHLHAIANLPPASNLRNTIENWKRYHTRFNKITWQRDFFDHRLRNPDQIAEKLNYIQMNPVRRGLCERAEDWPWVYRNW
jgi:REP element-mobilizing transposase RayT